MEPEGRLDVDADDNGKLVDFVIEVDDDNNDDDDDDVVNCGCWTNKEGKGIPTPTPVSVEAGKTADEEDEVVEEEAEGGQEKASTHESMARVWMSPFR